MGERANERVGNEPMRRVRNPSPKNHPRYPMVQRQFPTREASVSRSGPMASRSDEARGARGNWGVAPPNGRSRSPPAKDRSQLNGAESDDDIAAKPRTHHVAKGPPVGQTTSRAPAPAQPGQRTGTGQPNFFKSSATAAPPPDVVAAGHRSKRPAFDDCNDIAGLSALPSKASLYPARHDSQENLGSQGDIQRSRLDMPRSRAQIPDSQRPSVAQIPPQNRPTTPPVTVATGSAGLTQEKMSEYASKSPNGAALDLSSSTRIISDKLADVQTAMQTYSQQVDALRETTSSNKDAIAATNDQVLNVSEQIARVADGLRHLQDTHGERLQSVEAISTAMQVC